MVRMFNADEVISALRNKYQAPTFAFLTNVGNATGTKCNRYADAVAMCLWESRGLEIIGFEVKVSRHDWVKEMKSPGKADPIANYCDSWYLVVGDDCIVQPGELPMGWGLMVPHTKDSLRIVTESKRDLATKPLDKYFIASLLRRTTEQIIQDSVMTREFERGYKKGEEEQMKIDEATLNNIQGRYSELKTRVDAFCKRTGIDLDSWYYGDGIKIGDAVRVIIDGGYEEQLRHFDNLLKSAHNCVEYIQREMMQLKSIKPKEVDAVEKI